MCDEEDGEALVPLQIDDLRLYRDTRADTASAATTNDGSSVKARAIPIR